MITLLFGQILGREGGVSIDGKILHGEILLILA
jgi:hypothetical protein